MPAKTIDIGEWRPDAYASTEGLMTDVVNLIPSTEGYTGVKRFKPLTTAVPDFDVDCHPRGAESFIRPDKTVVTVVGTDSNLYIRGGDEDWTNVSQVVDGYSASDSRWKFVLFGDLLIATNYEDPIQCMNLETDTKFSDLSATAPKARDLAIVNEFLVLVGTNDTLDGERPQRVWWSPIGNPQGTWTPDQTTMCDYQDIFSGSYITGIIGGEDALILLRDALVRMSFVGSPVVFQFQTVTNDFGNIGFNTYTEAEGSVFFLSENGFKQYTGGGIEPIGLGKVDNFAYADTMGLVLSEAIACADVKNSCVWWAYRDRTAEGSGDLYSTTRALVYHYPTKRWGKVHEKIQSFCDVSTTGYTLDELDDISQHVDELPYSLDSEAWRGGVPVLGGFSADGKFGYFMGDFYDAEMTTGDFPLGDAYVRHFVRRIRPRVDGNDVTMQVALSGTQEESETKQYTSFMSKTRVGDFAFRVPGRFHSLKMKISGVYNKIVGFLIDYDVEGEF